MMTSAQWNNTLSYLQFCGFALLISALPLSNFLMSLGLFWLAGVWILQVVTDKIRGHHFKHRFQRFIKDRNALLLTSLYVLPLVGLLWTDDFKYARWDLRMKLPILFMPFLLTTLNPLSSRAYRALLGIFLLSLSFAVIWCLLIYWHVNPVEYKDVREISVFISHVRFSLLLILGLCIVYYEAWEIPSGKILCIMLSVLFMYFLYVIGSMTGFLVLLIVMAIALPKLILKTKKTLPKILWISAFIGITLSSFLYVRSHYLQYFNVTPIVWNELEKTTPRGDPYEHNPQYKAVEEGHYMMTHIAWSELYSGWAERSDIYPDSLDGRGQILKGTLIRYLASKDLKKDLDGIRALTDEDVKLIEEGITGVREKEKSGLHRRLDNIFFELANYRAGGNPGGHSVFQRFEFWKTALFMIREKPWFGVGTGDVKSSYADAYERMHSPLDMAHRLRAHNQYLTMWLTYGIGGLFLFLVIIVAPVVYNKNRNLLFTAYIIITSLSFLTEDTLESQAGVMFFAFFYLFFTLKKIVTPSELRPVK